MLGASPSNPGQSLFNFGRTSFQQQTPYFQQQQQQQQQQAAQPGAPTFRIHLLAKDTDQLKGQPVVHSTPWDGIHPDSQKVLLQIESRILEYREASRRLEQNARLNDSVALKRGFEEEAAAISQGLSCVATSIHSEQASLESLLEQAKYLLRSAEIAVRSFTAVRPRYQRSSGMPGQPGGGGMLQPASMDYYAGVPVLPSPFFQKTVERFEHEIVKYQEQVHELERLLLQGNGNGGSFTDDQEGREGGPGKQSIPQIMMNIHQFFIHVAAEADAVHSKVASARQAFLNNRRRRGDDSDPFLEEERREAAKRDAANKAMRHPGAPGLLAAAAPAGATAATAAPGLWPTPAAGAPTSGGLFSSPFGTAGSAPGGFSSPFGVGSTPAAGLTPGAATATPSFFGGAAASTPSLFSAGSLATTAPSAGAPGGLFSSLTPGAAPTPGSSTPSLLGASGGAGGGFTAPSLFGTPTNTPFGAATQAGTPSPFGGGLGGFGAPASFGTPQTPNMFQTGGAFGAMSSTPPPSGFAINPAAATAVTKAKPRATARRK